MSIDDTTCGLEKDVPRGVVRLQQLGDGHRDLCMWRVRPSYLSPMYEHMECKYFQEIKGNNLKQGRCNYYAKDKET